MYEYISGRLATITPTNAVIDCGGVGYLMEISLNTYSAIEHLQEARLWVHEVVREDAHLLYGFATPDEREMFRLLIGVNGVGSATARMILSSLSPEELQGAIASQDAKKMQRVKGVGAKTAQRIVLELHDKVSSTGIAAGGILTAVSQSKEEALSALVMLGFPKAAADKVLQPMDGTLPVETLIKEALKKL